jgi:PAS domain S-box-containing protein
MMDTSYSGSSRDIAKLKSRFQAVLFASMLATLCYLAAKLGGVLMMSAPQPLWPLWPGCAVLVAILLLLPKKIWPILIPAGLAGFVVYDLEAGVSIRSITWLILADTLEILVAAWGVNYSLNGRPRLSSLKALAKYSFFTVILGPLIVSSIGIFGLTGDRWISWRISFLSEGLAFLTVTPAILGWFDRGRTWGRVSRAFYLESAVLIAWLISLSYVIFVARGTSVPPALLYSLVPFLLWSALRFGSLGAGTSATIVAVLSIWGAIHGRGPFAETDSINRILSLQSFLLTASLPFMVLAVLVEEHKHTEIGLRESEKCLRLAMEARLRLAAVVESSDDAIISKNLDGTIVSWNAGAERLFGYSEAEAVGKSITMLIPNEVRDEEGVFMQRLGAGERVEHYETVRITKGGKRVAVSLTISPVKDQTGEIVGFSKIARDITDRKQAEQIIRESEERFRLVANSAPVLIWMSGTDKLCNFFNQGWLNFTGRSIEDELGEGWISDVHSEDVQRCVEVYSASFDAQVDFEMEYRLRRFDGEYRWMVDYGVPRFESDGNFCGYIGSCVDITERKSSAESLQALTGRLIHIQEEERARIARELHDDFSQRLALQCIDIEQLRKKLPGLEVEEQARLTRMLKRTKTMSSDIRSLSHELHSSRLDYIGLVPAVSGLCKEIGEKYKIEAQFTGSDRPVEIPKDVALCLFRVAQEALGNVVKHSQAKSVRVEIGFNLDGVSLRITDDGHGFDPNNTKPGVGLGLVGMSERLRLVGGRLSVKSEHLRGAEILAEVPLSDAAKEGWARALSAGGRQS